MTLFQKSYSKSESSSWQQMEYKNKILTKGQKIITWHAQAKRQCEKINGAPSPSKLNHNHQTTDTKNIENGQKPTTPHESPKAPHESPKNLTLSKASLNPF